MKTSVGKFLLFTLTLAALLLIPAFSGFAEEAAADAPHKETIFQTITQGGPLIIMIWLAIVGTSVTMVTFIIQNILTLREAKLAPPPLVQSLHDTIAAGKVIFTLVDGASGFEDSFAS